MTEFGLSSISEAFSSFSLSSAFPMTLAAADIWRSSSPSRRNARITLPSKIWSVICSARMVERVSHYVNVI